MSGAAAADDAAGGGGARCWHVYIVECIDGSLYTGITLDVAARLHAHARGRGARYTRAHPPAALCLTVPCPDRSSAARLEYAIKQRSVADKRRLIDAVSAAAAATVAADPASDPYSSFRIATEMLSPSPADRARARSISKVLASRAE